VPFVQGHLRGEALNVTIESECGHCGRPMRLEIDSSLNVLSIPTGSEPIVYFPMVDFDKLEDPSIIDAF
jgi:hypothetical protein